LLAVKFEFSILEYLLELKKQWSEAIVHGYMKQRGFGIGGFKEIKDGCKN
jgi:hypothetical protein